MSEQQQSVFPGYSQTTQNLQVLPEGFIPSLEWPLLGGASLKGILEEGPHDCDHEDELETPTTPCNTQESVHVQQPQPQPQRKRTEIKQGTPQLISISSGERFKINWPKRHAHSPPPLSEHAAAILEQILCGDFEESSSVAAKNQSLPEEEDEDSSDDDVAINNQSSREEEDEDSSDDEMAINNQSSREEEDDGRTLFPLSCEDLDAGDEEMADFNPYGLNSQTHTFWGNLDSNLQQQTHSYWGNLDPNLQPQTHSSWENLDSNLQQQTQTVWMNSDSNGALQSVVEITQHS
jgi:hypothetical protein